MAKTNMSMLSNDELKRYNRHIILQEIGLEGQSKLKEAKVLVIGAGGLGCPVLQYLAGAGVGTIGIIDHDIVSESNLQRQILYTSEDVGFPKAERAAQRLQLLNPFVKINPYRFKLTNENALNLFAAYDLIIDGTDNFPTRYLVNDACVILNKPLVFGSIFKFEGQVSVFNYKGGPTYRCLFPEPPKEGDVPNCSQIGVLGVLPGIIGSMQASEAIKVITGIGDVLSGKLFVLDTLSMQTQTYKFSKIPENSAITQLIDYEDFCNGTQAGVLKEVDVFELNDMLENKEDIQIVDVRDNYEIAICDLGGIKIPLRAIEQNVDKISRTKKVIVHCHHGGRSRSAIEKLQEEFGFTNLYNLKGGIHEWARQIDEAMATY
jgi:sulfur-carrier protein adenylyltransferase/sulfurtransferase